MPRASPIIALRNKISGILFEHKEHMESGVYQILYETLQEQTKNEPDENMLVSITYTKAWVSLQLDENGDPEQRVLQDARTRNILMPISMWKAVVAVLAMSPSHTCTFHNILPSNLPEIGKQFLAKHLDEPDLFDSTECACRIIRIEEYKLT